MLLPKLVKILILSWTSFLADIEAGGPILSSVFLHFLN